MMLPKISIIIPVYNVEKYLEKCLDSVVNQTLNNIEIICVNDGSTDNSLEILKEYAKKDDRIIIITKKNEGLGAARNTGMKVAKGKYVAFLDSDDWMENKALEDLYNIAVVDCIDVLIFKILPYDENNDKFFKRDDYELLSMKNLFKDSFVTYKDIKNDIFNIAVVAYNKIYKKSFLEKFNLKFPEGLIFEDNPFFFDAILNAEKIKFIDEYYLYRRFRDDSIITSRDERFFDIIPIVTLVLDVFRKNNLYENFKRPLLNHISSMIFSFAYKNIEEKYKIEFFGNIKDYFLKIKQDTFLNKDFESNLNEYLLSFYTNVFNASSSKEFDLSNDIYAFKHEINNLKKNNKKLSEDISTIRRQYDNLGKEYRNISAKYDGLSSKYDGLSSKYGELYSKYKILAVKNKNHKNELNNIYSSNSWKMTKYFRIIGKNLNNLL